MKIFRVLACLALILGLGTMAAQAQSSVTMEGNCLAKCPGPSLTYRVSGENDSGALATVEVDVILPTGARFNLLTSFIGPGSFSLQKLFAAPAGQPASCPATLTLEASLILAGGEVQTSSDDVEIIPLN